MREGNGGIFEFVLITIFVFACLSTILFLFGCSSCEPSVVYKPVVVEVPVMTSPPPIVIEEDKKPEKRSLTANENDFLEYIRAVAQDLLDSWLYNEYLEWKIANHNLAISDND